MKKWSDKSVFEKILDVISGIALCVWLIFEMLGKTQGVEYADTVSYVAIIVICVCEAFSFRNEKPFISYIAIAGIVCIVATIILEALYVTP